MIWHTWIAVIIAGLSLLAVCAIGLTTEMQGRIDTITLTTLHEWFSQRGLQIAFFECTCIGSMATVIACTATVALVAVRRHQGRAAIILVSITIADLAVNEVVKITFHRPRPDLFTVIGSLPTYSFPSGHAMAAVAVYGTIAVVLSQVYPRARPTMMVLAPMLVLLIGASRLVLGVHWPSDVLAAYGLGLVLLATACHLLQRLSDVTGER